MSFNQFIKHIKRNWQTALTITILVTVLAFSISAVMPAKYRSSVSLLVIPKQNVSLDVYTAAKSTEYIAKVMSELIYSQSFLNAVAHSGYDLDLSHFSQDPEKLKKQWSNMIDSKIVSSTGMIRIDAFHTNKNQAHLYALAASEVLVNQNVIYFGGGYADVKTIDSPITTRKPVSPNIWLNTAIGMLIGGFLGMSVLYLFPEYTITYYSRKKKSPLNLPIIDNNGDMQNLFNRELS